MRFKSILIAIIVLLTSCEELLHIAKNAPVNRNELSNTDISRGLKEALNQGVNERVKALSQEDGFFKNESVKILLPEEVQKVDDKIRKIGLGSLSDEGLKLLNRAGEDAVKEALPIFKNAIQNMSFKDAKNILMGHDSSATSYLISNTRDSLYQRFLPVVSESLKKVGAAEIWQQIINRYNAIPFTKSINPDLNDYVTNEALKGVFLMITKEEKNIRNQIDARKSDLLQRVFKLQD